ncbi:hypothetical protein BH23PAT1_BH23PAT1_0820 [soil metagenome]
MNSVLLNVCIIPNNPVSAECVSISQSLKSNDTLFVLGADKFAHMNVYMARFAKEAVENVLGGVEQALQSASLERAAGENILFFRSKRKPIRRFPFAFAREPRMVFLF